MDEVALYFVRGRGRGHALAALDVARKLPGPVQFVSYATGARVLREHGVTVWDLRLKENPDLFSVRERAGKWIVRRRPSLLVAHEEFEALEAAARAGVDCIAVTDWFLPDENDWRMKSLGLAREVWMLEEPGVYPEPSYLLGKVKYRGPALRPLACRRNNREKMRREMGFGKSDFVVALFVYPGRRTEQRAPLRRLLQEAVGRLECRGKKIVLYNRDGDADFCRTMLVADVGITKGNRNLVLEMGKMGLPSITVDYGLNTIDSYRVRKCSWNQTIEYGDLTVGRLVTALQLAI